MGCSSITAACSKSSDDSTCFRPQTTLHIRDWFCPDSACADVPVFVKPYFDGKAAVNSEFIIGLCKRRSYSKRHRNKRRARARVAVYSSSLQNCCQHGLRTTENIIVTHSVMGQQCHLHQRLGQRSTPHKGSHGGNTACFPSMKHSDNTRWP